MRPLSTIKLLLPTAGLAAGAALVALGLPIHQGHHTPEISVSVAQSGMQLGSTVTQSAAPSAPDTPAATPPVKADPAPTSEPG